MDADLNRYDVEHVCTAHPRMSKAEWEAIYQEAWSLYYTPEHMKTLLRRAAATGVPMGSLLKVLVTFAMMVPLEKVHPLQAGIFRLKRPSERRPGLPRESGFVFWPRYALDVLYKHAVLAGTVGRLVMTKLAIDRDPKARHYMDEALTPVHDDGDATLDLMTKTTGATAALAHIKKVAMLTAAGRV
jgi:hypothetical protein